MFALIIAKKKCTAKRKYEDEHSTLLTEGRAYTFLLNVMVSHFAFYVRRH